MHPLAIAQTLMDDPRPEVRSRGPAIAAEAAPGEAEKILVAAMADPSQEVGAAARRALRFRQPYLVLAPFPTRPLSEDARTTSGGEAWQALHQGIRLWLAGMTHAPSRTILQRWCALPGAVPDLVAGLQARGFEKPAADFAREANLYGSGRRGGRQVLLCPTYRCNLNCAYCYSRGWHRYFKTDLSPEDLNTFLDWCGEQRIENLILGGGEPTVYTHLELLLHCATARGIKIFLTSNTLFPKRVRDLIGAGYIHEFIAHYDQDLMANADLNRQFERNLEALQQAGIALFLRYTLTPQSNPAEWRRVINLARQHEISTLNYAFAFGNFLGDNTYFDYRTPQCASRFQRQFTEFFAACRANGMAMHLCKPIPLCLVEEDFLRELLLTESIRSSCSAYLDNYCRNVTVNPDLSTIPCNAMGILGPRLTSGSSPESLGACHWRLLQSILYKPFIPQCNQCMFFYRGFCQGVCLVEKLRGMPPGATRSLDVLSQPQ